jgi:PAS domain S-box-containing protein
MGHSYYSHQVSMTEFSKNAERQKKLREHAEQRLRKVFSAQQEPQQIEFHALKQLHELQVSQIELEVQHTELLELQLAREELSGLLKHYTKLYELAPMGYFTVSRDGILREVNLNGADLFGIARADLAGKLLRNFVSAKYRSAFNDFFSKIFSGQGRESFELEFVNTDQQPFFAQLEASVEDSGQNCFIVMRDISSRKIFEKALRDSHEELKDEVRKQTVQLVRANEQLKSQVAEQKLTEQVLKHTKDMLRELGVYQERVKEDERKRIAREIHDELGSLLTGIKAHISVAQVHAMRAGLPEDPELAAASALTDCAVETVRRVVADLRPSVLDQLGIWAALEWHADQFKGQDGLNCEFKIDAEAAATGVDPERSTALYRIVQEAITNVVRHSHATHVLVHVMRHDDTLQVEIQDDGKGLSIGSQLDRNSFGIIGMRERALNLGGELSITSEAGKGTLVALCMPLKITYEK